MRTSTSSGSGSPLILADLLALAQSMLLTDQPELHRAEPKPLRYNRSTSRPAVRECLRWRQGISGAFGRDPVRECLRGTVVRALDVGPHPSLQARPAVQGRNHLDRGLRRPRASRVRVAVGFQSAFVVAERRLAGLAREGGF